MDETLQDLENELLNLRPRRPSAALQARLEATLAASARTAPPGRAAATPLARTWQVWLLASAAILALVAATTFWRTPASPPAEPVLAQATVPTAASAAHPVAPDTGPVSESHYRPVAAASVLYDLKEDDDVYLSGQTPVRRVRYRYVDTYTWKNPATNASLKWSVPRDEIRVLPASFH